MLWAGPGTLRRWCSDPTPARAAGPGYGRGVLLSSSPVRGVTAWSPSGRPGPCTKGHRVDLPSGALLRAFKIPRGPVHRAKPPFPFSPSREPRAPHGRGWVQEVGGAATPCICYSRGAVPVRGTDSAPQWRLGALASGLSSGTGLFRAIMSHKALGPWGTPAGRGLGAPTPRRGDARGHFTRHKLLPGQ